MNGDPYSSRDTGRSRDHYSSRHDRDDRRDRDRGHRDDRREGHRDRDRERRRSRSPHHRSRREYEDSYSSSRDYRAREREDRYSNNRRDDREWGRDRAPRRRDDDRPPRRDRDLFDDRRGGGGGGPGQGRQRDRDDRGAREDRDEFAAQARGAKDEPAPKKREPTPDLTDVVPILERKRRLTQWDIKPPGYESVTAEQAKLSGMFPLPGAPRQQMDPKRLEAFVNQSNDVDKAALKPSSARQSKRLFLHNVPASVKEEDIVNWFNLHLNGLNVIPSRDPCVSASIAGDRSFVLTEFKLPEDATVALAMDGEAMEEHMTEANGSANSGVPGFEIKRPKDYIVPSPEPETYNSGPEGYSTLVPDSENKICIAKIPPYLTEDQVSELVKAFGELKAFVLARDKSTDESRGFAFVEYQDSAATQVALEGLSGMELGEFRLKTSLASIGYKQAAGMEMGVSAMSMFAGAQSSESEESRVLQLLNMVTAEELIDNDEYEEICEDIQEECSKYGEILEMKIPRPAGGSRQSNGVGKIFIKYSDAESAKKALQSLAGRKFADRTVVTTYFDEASFEVNAW